LLKAHLGDKYLPVGIGAVVILQLLFTYAPPLQRLFDNQAVPLRVWPSLLAGGLVFFIVAAMEKLVIRSTDRLRCIVTTVETGT
jgi:cation transport ATPase-like protein